MFKEGDFLRHRGKPEWGTGKVVSADADKIQILFATGPVTLKLSVAGAMLEAAEAPPSTPRTRKSRGAAATDGRERQGPALDGGLVPSAKGYDHVQVCRGCAARRFAVSTHLARVQRLAVEGPMAQTRRGLRRSHRARSTIPTARKTCGLHRPLSSSPAARSQS